jgi:hypothetical protein
VTKPTVHLYILHALIEGALMEVLLSKVGHISRLIKLIPFKGRIIIPFSHILIYYVPHPNSF